jgi:hypothetical protein
MNYAVLAMRARPYVTAAVPPTPTITIIQQPSDQTVDAEGVTFTVVAVKNFSANLEYQWQQKLPSSSEWQDILDFPPFAIGATTASYTQTAFTGDANGTRYRVIISATGADSVTSNEATLTL